MERKHRSSHLFAVVIAFTLVSSPTPELRADPGSNSGKLEDQRHLVELGLFFGGHFPPKAHEAYDIDVGWKALDRGAFMVGGRVAYLPLSFVGLELEGAVIPTGLRSTDDSALMYTVRGHAIGQLPYWQLVPFLLVGYGALGISSSDSVLGDDIDGAFHAGVGVKWYPKRWLVARLDGRLNVGGETGAGGMAPHFEILMGLSYVLGWKKPAHKDRDGDGVPDASDRCPGQPGAKP